MFNLLPGQGLGFTGSKLLAFGLIPVSHTVIVIPTPIPKKVLSSPLGASSVELNEIAVYDNAYSIQQDDNDIVEILNILFGVIE